MCHSILKSQCAKQACSIDRKKPEMIMVAESTQLGKKEYDSFSSASDDDEYDSDGFEVISTPSKENADTTVSIIKACWADLSPPNPFDEIEGKWFAVAWSTKKVKALYIAKVLHRFLEDEGGEVDKFQMQFLKPKLGSGTVLEDTPAHLPDVSFVQLKDIIAGPIQVVPMRGEKRDIPDYMRIKSHFEASKKIDLDKLFDIFMDKTN